MVFAFSAINKSIRQKVNLTICTDDSGSIFVDGVRVLNTEVFKTYSVEINHSFDILAVFVTNILGHIGIMAETSTGIVTDTSWKCTDREQRPGWITKRFNDSLWPSAVIIAHNKGGHGLMPQLHDFPEDGLWISVSNAFAKRLYCRKKIKRQKDC